MTEREKAGFASVPAPSVPVATSVPDANGGGAGAREAAGRGNSCAIADGAGLNRCPNDAWVCHPHLSEEEEKRRRAERHRDAYKAQLGHARRAIRDLLDGTADRAEVERWLAESLRTWPEKGGDA